MLHFGRADNIRSGTAGRAPERTMRDGNAIRDTSLRMWLREETREQHERLHLLPGFARLAEGTLDRAGYGRLMSLLHGYYAGLDAPLAGSAARHLGPSDPLAEQPRSALIAADVESLGTLPDVAEAAAPPLDSAGQLAGVLYVVEGSLLGASGLARGAARHAGGDGISGTGYWQWCRQVASRRWGRTCAALPELVLDDGDRDEARHAALATFAAFGAWFGAAR
jgi:heme oxygenase (biliverdin-IX-beta and delta-forming)